jgi:hypothetical protein
MIITVDIHPAAGRFPSRFPLTYFVPSDSPEKEMTGASSAFIGVGIVVRLAFRKLRFLGASG